MMYSLYPTLLLQEAIILTPTRDLLETHTHNEKFKLGAYKLYIHLFQKLFIQFWKKFRTCAFLRKKR